MQSALGNQSSIDCKGRNFLNSGSGVGLGLLSRASGSRRETFLKKDNGILNLFANKDKEAFLTFDSKQCEAEVLELLKEIQKMGEEKTQITLVKSGTGIKNTVSGTKTGNYIN